MQIKKNSNAYKALQFGRIEEAFNIFKDSGSVLGQAYCYFLSGNLNQAKILLNLIKDSYSAVKWLICLISIIEDKKIESTTYFQIRNFYEQDLEMLFLYNQQDYIKKVIQKNSYLENYNKEIYKYSARVLKNNKQNEIALKLLKKSLDIFYKDPETHYLLGEIYEEQKDYNSAKKEYIKANEATGDYLPAKNKLKKLSN